ACDGLTGFLGACVKVRPSRQIADLPVASVVKRLKDKAFARSVNRNDVYGGAEELGVPLEEHIAFLIEALKPIAEEIGLLPGAVSGMRCSVGLCCAPLAASRVS